MAKTKKSKIISITNCGGKKKGSCGTWAGATKGETAIKIAA